MIGLDTRRILRISAHVHSFTLKMHVQAICNHMFIFYKTFKDFNTSDVSRAIHVYIKGRQILLSCNPATR